MRLSELLDRQVVSTHGDVIGYVVDVRLVQDGPLIGPYGASLRLDGLIVVHRRHLRLLGYDRDVGPAYIRAVITRLTGDALYVPWTQVRSLDDVITVAESRQLRLLRDLPHHSAGR
jgi:sporulation protein YlmC with PRC-barrel domain